MQRDLEAKRASHDGLEAELLAERSAAQEASAAAEAREAELRALQGQLAGVQVSYLLKPAVVVSHELPQQDSHTTSCLLSM